MSLVEFLKNRVIQIFNEAAVYGENYTVRARYRVCTNEDFWRCELRNAVFLSDSITLVMSCRTLTPSVPLPSYVCCSTTFYKDERWQVQIGYLTSLPQTPSNFFLTITVYPGTITAM